MRLQFLFFLPAVLAWWNCELPSGTGDNGRCIDGTTGNWDACSASNPCRVQGNGCSPQGSRIANCS
ncbi:hypothetical protein FOPG_10605 [Fusarium oxysporum f. sp. conglutinans race 2 54008]|uniref:Uncharacterized protein n=2 Tax=Fusarium oxysporum TaxID=5507 RepID=X0MM40_FUSOX|nr:hypothetical protein FOPG_10605 [Fusarium oxysporum f. sp. conglutinans race 2 54008]EXM21635.1 hypothetical protein FOTG_10566 [Fusarium oxysporum f. sp. vasinfectum 25433]